MKKVALMLVMVSLNSLASDWQSTINLREKLTYLSAVEFDSSSSESGLFWTQRFTAETKYSANESWSVNGGIISALQEGVDESPVERNNLDLYTAYVAYKGANGSVQIGRQTLKLGSQRLIGWRDGTNVRRTWQGIKADWNIQPTWQSSWFAMELIGLEANGIFNDNAESENRLAGSYHTLSFAGSDWLSTADIGVDLYYIYTNRDNRNSIEGSGSQIRHTLGVRHFGDFENWYWDWEAIYQSGSHNDLDIRAWSVASKTGYIFDAIYNPEIMLSINVGSGDKENGDDKLQTFDALFPRGDYFSGAAILGPSNFYNAHAHFIVNPTESLRLALDINLYWRLETEDGVYGPPGNIIARPNNNNSKAVDLSYSSSFEWKINDRFSTVLLATYARPQEFLRESGLTDDTYFIEWTVDWKL